MPALLNISVRFLLDEFDGHSDGGKPEWPPSPLRLFQTLTNSAARLGMATFAPSLEHLEKLPPPIVVASKPSAIQPGYGFKTFVPNNHGDLVAKSWSRGRDNDIANYRAAKEIRPKRLPENAVVVFSWELTDELPPGFSEHIRQLAHAISAFGWGANMVVADAVVAESGTTTHTNESTEIWFPAEGGVSALRVPVSGTLAALEHRHKAFLARLPTAPDGSQFFQPVPPLEHFRVLTYRRETDTIRPPFAIFALRHLDGSGFRAFDPIRRGLHVAAMLRHGTEDMARLIGWKDARIARLVHGHADEESADAASARLLFLPLPSIEARGEGRMHVVSAIRRVLVTCHGSMPRDEFQRLVQRLDGMELIDEKSGAPTALLSRLPDSDRLTKSNYLRESSNWATVTPVILPGYDDPRKLRQRLRENSGLTAKEKQALVAKLEQRIDRLLRKALHQAGYSDVITRHAAIEWRGSGFLPGADLASRYTTGDQHRRFRKLHVLIQFRDEQGQALSISGPLCIGGGRFSGTGLFAALG